MPKSLEASQAPQQPVQQSTANTPAPDSFADSSQSKAGVSSSSFLGNSATTDETSLAEALNLLSRYGDEYMDEASLTGEPGSFIISKKAPPPPPPAVSSSAAEPSRSHIKSNSSTPAPGGTAIGTPISGEPTVLKIDATGVSGKGTGKGAEKTPTTPGGGKEKPKRKKSKVGSAGP